MKKVTLLISLIFIILFCSSCRQDNLSQGENSEGDLDYLKAYQDDVEQFVELNDIENISIDENKTQVVLYYKDSKGFLVPVMRQIDKQESIAKSVIKGLVNTDENRLDLRNIGLCPVLPEGIDFELALKEDNLMRISFNELIQSFKSEEEERQAIQAIVYTLTEFETVDIVQILVNNQIIDSLPNGTDISEPLTRGNINAINNIVDGEYVKSTFYIYDKAIENYTYYVPITKNIPKENRNLKDIVQEELSLLRENNINYLKGIELVDVIEEDANVIIKLDGNFEGADVELDYLVKSLCLTINQNSPYETVRVLLGEKVITKAVPTFANVY